MAFVDPRPLVPGTTTSTSYTDERPVYMLLCRDCGTGDLAMPFESAEARGKWAAAHRDVTGHDRWWCPDYTPPAPSD